MRYRAATKVIAALTGAAFWPYGNPEPDPCPDCGETKIRWESTYFPEDYCGDIYGECLCGMPIRQTDNGRYEWLNS